MKMLLTESEIIEARKNSNNFDLLKPWSETIAFARKLEALLLEKLTKESLNERN